MVVVSRDDEERFAAVYDAHYRAIYAYVYRRLTPRGDEVRDVVAEVFSVAWRRIKHVPGGEEELIWLYGVARRCVLRAQRSYRRRLRLLTRLSEEARARPTDDPTASGEDEVRDAIERLRPLDREVLRLVMWEGLSHSEAAGVLGCSVNAVAQRLHNARERLRVDLTRSAAGAPEPTRRAQSV
jgi:RNA polymerase sigma-70 factor (ECF subfamily)